MPTSVRQAIAHYDFTRENLANVMQIADDVYLSTKPSSMVAAISPPTTNPNSDLSTPEVLNQAFNMPSSQDEATAQIASLAAQVAAISKKFGGGRGRGRGGRGGRGRGGGSSQATPHYSAANPRWTTPRHADLPPFSSCKRHWQFGKSSFVCLEPTSCPWRNHIQQKTQN